MSQVAIGLDIAKGKFDVARLCEGKYRHKKFDNNPQGFAALTAWLEGFGDGRPRVCMEATGAFSVPLAECLARGPPRVSVVNPAKTDAKLIAHYCLAMRPGPKRPVRAAPGEAA